MALLYDPGRFMPRKASDFDHMSWMLTWPNGPWCLHDTEPGGTVYLVRAGKQQRIVWQTIVTAAFAVPYEHVDELALEVRRRWGLSIDTTDMVPSGFCIGWRAEPVQLVEQPARPVDVRPGEEEGPIELDGFQQSRHMGDAFRQVWGLEDDEPEHCTGRPAIGWFALA